MLVSSPTECREFGTDFIEQKQTKTTKNPAVKNISSIYQKVYGLHSIDAIRRCKGAVYDEMMPKPGTLLLCEINL